MCPFLFTDISIRPNDDGIRAVWQIHNSISTANAILQSQSQLLQSAFLRYITTNSRLLTGRIVLLQVRSSFRVVLIRRRYDKRRRDFPTFPRQRSRHARRLAVALEVRKHSRTTSTSRHLIDVIAKLTRSARFSSFFLSFRLLPHRPSPGVINTREEMDARRSMCIAMYRKCEKMITYNLKFVYFFLRYKHSHYVFSMS